MAKTNKKLSLDTTETNETPTEQPTEGFSRQKIGTQVVQHDLFKLLPAKMVKDVSYNPDAPILVHLDHCHIYHTVDSNGKAMTESSPVGNHHHKVIVDEVEGKLKVYVSEAMRYVKRGKKVFESPLANDHHTHEVQYLGSHEVKARELNTEFVKLQSQMAATVPGPVEGILG